MRIGKLALAYLIIPIIFLAGLFFLYFGKNTAIPAIGEPPSVTEYITNLTQPYVSPISIDFLREQSYPGSDIVIEETLSNGSNYHRYIASYQSEGNKIYGLLTVPFSSDDNEKFPAIVFNHGYIPPRDYRTTEKYVAYVDTLARNKFVVFKIDLRGHGNSEGNSSGSYFSNAYTFDALNAVNSLAKYKNVDGERIGMWGHSMSGNLALRAALVSDKIKATVIWAGAVYSYSDYGKYRISDSSFRGIPTPTASTPDKGRETSKEISELRSNPESVDFNTPFWQSISLTQNLEYLNSPIQLHHSENDDVVNVGYSKDLETALQGQNKTHETYYYSGGGHNIESPYFEQAIARTVEFYNKHLRDN